MRYALGGCSNDGKQVSRDPARMDRLKLRLPDLPQKSTMTRAVGWCFQPFRTDKMQHVPGAEHLGARQSGSLRHVHRRSFLLTLFASATVSGCAATERLPPEAVNQTDQTTVLGIPNARFYADTQAAEMVQEALRAVERERAANPGSLGPGARLPPANYLGLSGGSDNGAFGAGLLVGWTDAGTRPEFKLVSGVSTGALIAPFAFLGSAYDPQLRAVYTGVQPGNIYEKRSILTALFGESFADTTPLYDLISLYVDDAMMAAIAREYGRGRLLLARPILMRSGRSSGTSARLPPAASPARSN
jgi:hypothetical protein